MTAEMQLDSYLTALRAHLGPLTIAEREEIVREIAAHVRDSAEETGASVETVLARLGPAEELAAQYRDGFLIRQASRSISPVKLLRATLRLATKGVFGIVVFFLAIIGYSMGAGLVLTALVKPFSGSAARAMLIETMHSHGVDSFPALLAATMQGSTETTFYVLAVYFGSVGIQRARHAVGCALLADLSGVLASIGVCYWFFG